MNEDTTPGCSECGGIGFLILVESGRSRARPCACRAKVAVRPEPIAAFLEQARVPPRYRDCDFQNFDACGTGTQAVSLEAAKSLARRYADEYPLDERGGLMFMGPPGAGKTHLAVATLRQLAVEKGVESLFCDMQDLLRALRGSFDRASGTSEADLLKGVLATEVVVLDDLGGWRLSPWVEETLAHIVTTRYNARLATLVTTNYWDDPPGEGDTRLSDRIGPRVRSRLHEMCHLVRMEALDFRQTVHRADYHRPVQRAAPPRSGP